MEASQRGQLVTTLRNLGQQLNTCWKPLPEIKYCSASSNFSHIYFFFVSILHFSLNIALLSLILILLPNPHLYKQQLQPQINKHSTEKHVFRKKKVERNYLLVESLISDLSATVSPPSPRLNMTKIKLSISVIQTPKPIHYCFIMGFFKNWPRVNFLSIFITPMLLITRFWLDYKTHALFSFLCFYKA